jgi:hypothetical protein
MYFIHYAPFRKYCFFNVDSNGNELENMSMKTNFIFLIDLIFNSTDMSNDSFISRAFKKQKGPNEGHRAQEEDCMDCVCVCV